jgi:hypothetical protein
MVYILTDMRDITFLVIRTLLLAIVGFYALSAGFARGFSLWWLYV